jgi:hypothetical protein
VTNGKPDTLWEVFREWAIENLPLETPVGSMLKIERTVSAGRIADSLIASVDKFNEKVKDNE